MKESLLKTSQCNLSFKCSDGLYVYQTSVSDDCWGLKLDEQFHGAGIKRGDIILETDPLMVAIYGETSSLHNSRVVSPVCSYCCSFVHTGQSLNLCSQCKVAFFCSRSCQKAAWTRFHKYECKHWRNRCKDLSIREKIRGSFTVRLLVMLLLQFETLGYTLRDFMNYQEITLTQDVPLKDVYGSQSTDSSFPILSFIQQLYPRWLKKKETITDFFCDDKEYILQLIDSILCHKKDSEKESLHRENVFHLLDKITHNSVCVLNSSLTSVGAGLYPFMTFLNHSCIPNCAIMFKGVRLYIVCLRDIVPGENLTIGYTSTVDPLPERKKTLMKQYRFFCQCVFCHEASIFSKAYNLLCEEPICPACYQCFPVDYPIVGSLDWFVQEALNEENSSGNLRRKASISEFFTDPCTLQNIGDALLCRRCRKRFPRYSINFEKFKKENVETLDFLEKCFNDLEKEIDPSRNKLVSKALQNYPSKESLKVLAPLARVKRFRDYVSFLTDTCVAFKAVSKIETNRLQRIQLNYLILDVVVNHRASDFVTNLLQVRLAQHLRCSGDTEKATAIIHDVFKVGE